RARGVRARRRARAGNGPLPGRGQAGRARGCGRRHLGQHRHRRPAGRGAARQRQGPAHPATDADGNAMNPACPIRTPALAAALAALALAAAPSHAQDAAEVETRTIDACVAVENDAMRLACYDAVAGRDVRTPEQADQAAERAAEVAGRLNLFRRDAELPSDSVVGRALANVGQGSLQDSRWELARDSKLGLFNFRAYKPVYLFPVFWTVETNTRPHSPNPDNTVTQDAVLDQL